MTPNCLRPVLLIAAAWIASAALAEQDDPYIWMEEIEGERALAWARAENERSLKLLQADPQFTTLHADALAILNAKDRIPSVGFAGNDELRNFWQDADHVRGIWRRTTLENYRSETPAWEVLLDVDALAKAEQANWVWSDVSCLPPEDRLCLVSLSDAGKDAVDVREFDTRERAFVEGGFRLPEGKHRLAWLDAETILVATEWQKGELTTAGYPYIVKSVKRGQPLSAAHELFRGDAKDGGYGVDPLVLRDADGAVQAVMALRPLDTFTSEYYLIGDQAPVKLPLPLKSTVQTFVQDKLAFTLEEAWPARNLKEGDLAAYDLAALRADPDRAVPQLVLRPGPRESIEEVASTRGKLVVALYENVKGAIFVFEPKGDTWTRSKLEQLPGNSSLGITTASDRSDQLIVNVAGFLTPTTQWLADGATGRVERLKALTPRFDASNHLVEQFEATSKDGTKIPYFVVRPKGVELVGAAPTLLYAYGGFQISMTPWYSGIIGKLWLERGGTFVVANIRGGGEFGPAWHNAGLKENRQKVYDDFFAVSEDLIARKITNPRRLGIMGGSNGGLLMGVALTQRPELYNAVVIQVPLFDMIRYTQIGAGASWAGEYGDPAIPAERAYIEGYSPYQKLRAGQRYPEVFLETSTADDRVHPAHARKAAARLAELGYDFLYYENMEGGHSAAANLNQAALIDALEFTYLSRRLMGCGCEQGIEEGYVTTPDGVRLYYQKVGTSPQVVIQPGRLFVFPEFEWLGEHVTLISYDMRNRGRSDLVLDESKITFEQDVADIEAVRRHFGVERMALMGYSYLGKIVVLYALEHPERVERIVQFGPVGPNFSTEYQPEYVFQDDPVDPAARTKLRALRSEQSYHLTHPREYCEEEWKVAQRPMLIGDPSKIDRVRISVCDMPNEWPILQMRHLRAHFEESGMTHVTPLDRVRLLPTPVLTMHGTHDRNAPYGAGREWSYLLPNGRLLAVEGAAHHAFGEAREVVMPAVLEFLRGQWPAAAVEVTEDPRK